MKIYTLLLLSINLTLFANPIITKLECINQQLHLHINTNQLNLTDEALVDNTGGYVDIPEERYYLKTDTTIVKLKAKVVKDSQNHTNQFQTILTNDDTKKINNNFTLIQKIDLIEHNLLNQKENITTTNKLIISFNTKEIEQLQMCQE